MAVNPMTSAAADTHSPAHHMPDGLEVSTPAMSRVTSAEVLLPVMSGCVCNVLPMALTLGVRAHDLQVVHDRARVDLLEHAIGAVGLDDLRHAALRIVEVAEHDCVRRTRLLTRGLDVAVLDPAAGALAFDARLLDALHAEGAFFHDA